MGMAGRELPDFLRWRWLKGAQAMPLLARAVVDLRLAEVPHPRKAAQHDLPNSCLAAMSLRLAVRVGCLI